jgi:hypothetical protein
MALPTLVNGVKAMPVAKEPSLISMETNTLAGGSITNVMATACILLPRVLNTKEIGRTISNVDKVKNTGLKMVHFITVLSLMEKKRAMVNTFGRTVRLTKVTGPIIKLMVLANTPGKMAENTTANGKRTTCTELVFIDTLTVLSTKDNILKTLNSVLDITNGLMVDFMKDGGSKASNTALESTLTLILKKALVMDFGSTAKDKFGIIKKQSTPSMVTIMTTLRISRIKLLLNTSL